MKNKLSQLISDKFDIPLNAISNIPNAQMIGNSFLEIDSCIGIKKYEENEIIIRSKHFVLRVNGNSLSMLTFSEGRVNIRGEIHSYSIDKI